MGACGAGRQPCYGHEGLGRLPRYAVDMVGVGEASGRLEEVLRSLGVYYDEEDRLFAKIRSSVGYPAALLCIMSIILAFTVIIILPGVRGRVRLHGRLAHRRLLGSCGRVRGHRLGGVGHHAHLRHRGRGRGHRLPFGGGAHRGDAPHGEVPGHPVPPWSSWPCPGSPRRWPPTLPRASHR